MKSSVRGVLAPSPWRWSPAVLARPSNQYLVNVPHQFFKVYGLGDVYSPKEANLTVEQRYQNVRIVAVYDTNQAPVLPAAPKS